LEFAPDQIVSGIVVLSVSRIEGLGVLRLHAWGTNPQVSMPMDPKYFFFVQNVGAYHLVRFHQLLATGFGEFGTHN
jgi:hypothetical protein